MALFYLPFGDTIQSGYACPFMRANEITSIHMLFCHVSGLLISRVNNTSQYNVQGVLMSTPPLHKLMAKGGDGMREKKELNVRIGNQIRLAREAAGLTQERFAEMVSLATENISDIERGVVGLSIGSLIRICETLAISSDELLFGRPDSKTEKNDTSNIANRLAKLPPQQFAIASDIINKLFEAFATTK